ncbi:hypothetical protein MHY1_03245 [Methylovirgula sp. HY1]|nr:hypothetical protein MHY1_03245 [Methylovirgula sp. HY1]
MSHFLELGYIRVLVDENMLQLIDFKARKTIRQTIADIWGGFRFGLDTKPQTALIPRTPEIAAVASVLEPFRMRTLCSLH